jgi:tRNA-5-methyluridine54 2-sulfurtransferase
VKCTRCSAAAVIEVRRHNAAYCKGCFVAVFRNQVARSIDQWSMIAPGDRVLVAVSGGKDSLALWDVLLEAGHDATGLSLDLGIGGYSGRSQEATRAFAADRGAPLLRIELAEAYGFDVPTAGRKGSRSTCAVCGLSKRYAFNKAAVDGGFDVIATGHNLDDEAATLLGNTLRWNTEYIARQAPVLPASEGFVKKVKPLHRISELETAAYAFVRGIDYVVEECPLVAGNTQLRYKEAMNAIESRSPGTKAQFFLGYLDRARPMFTAAGERPELRPCRSCGQPTTGSFCAFCRARAQILGERLQAADAGADRPDDQPDDRQVAAELAEEVLPAELYDLSADRG